MGIYDKNGKTRGKVRDFTFRVVNGQNVIQSRPVRGTTDVQPITLSMNKEFCLASNRARIIRETVEPFLKSFYDGKMINRLNAAVAKTIKSNPDRLPGQRDLVDGQLDRLSGFEFNMNSPFASNFRVNLEVKALPAGLQLIIPAFDPRKQVTMPSGATECQLKVLLSAIDLEKGRYSQCEIKKLFITENSAPIQETNWLFNSPVAGRFLLMLSATLSYESPCLTDKLSLNNKELNPVTLLKLHPVVVAEADVIPTKTGNIMGLWYKIKGLNGSSVLKKS